MHDDPRRARSLERGPARGRSLLRTATLASLTLGLGLASSSAHAAFPFATCATGSWDTAVPTELGALEYVKKTLAPLGGATDMTLYNLNTKQSWTVFTNPNVQFLQPSFGYFVTEANFDNLKISPQLGGPFVYTGSINTSTVNQKRGADSWDLGSGSSDVAYFTQEWTSDTSVANNTPPNIASVFPKCKATQSTGAFNNVTISANSRVDGLLIKTGDVVYFSVFQPANRRMVIRLDGLAGTAGADFDLFASATTTLPDNANFTWVSSSSQKSEAVQIEPVASQRKIYIAVHSFAGAGHFALSADAVESPPIADQVCVTDSTLKTRVTLDATKTAQLQAFLAAGSAHTLAYSNGALWRRAYTLNKTWTGTCDANNLACSICIVNDASGISFGTPAPSGPTGHVEMHGGNWTQGAAGAWLFAHETGHSAFGLPDQYQLPPAGAQSPRYCGHTTMANNPLATAYCSMAHCKDGTVTDANACSTAGNSDWQTIASSGTWGPKYLGPKFAKATTGFPTPSWTNARLTQLVQFVGF